jgi:hypothetical protein
MADVSLNAAPPEGPPAEKSRIVGRTGLKHWGGYIQQEFLPELRGDRAYRIYDEMRNNEPTIGGFLLAMEMIITTTEYEVKAGIIGGPEPDGADKAAALHVNKALHQMRRTLDSILIDVCTMFPFGYAPLELVYRMEEGKIWWDDWAFRIQEATDRWVLDDETGELKTYVQRPAPEYKPLEIPAWKLLLFRTREEGNNPEGRSILRTAYKPYFYKRVLEEIEAIGAERDLIGLPVMRVPYGATDAEVDEAQRIVENVKNDDQGGFVSTAIGPEPDMRFELTLLTGQGSSGRVSYTDRLIARYSSEMALSALAQFIQLGTAGRSGNYNLSSDQRDLFQVVVKGWLERILGTINRDAIPRLLAMNGMTGKCYMTHGRITQLNLQSISNFLAAGVQNKFITPSKELENFLRREAELPELTEEEIADAEAKAAMAPTPPIPGGKGPTAGVNANPGDNQRGLFSPATAGAEVEGGPKPIAATEDDDEPITFADLDDNEIWEQYAATVLSKMSGEFWEE